MFWKFILHCDPKETGIVTLLLVLLMVTGFVNAGMCGCGAG